MIWIDGAFVEDPAEQPGGVFDVVAPFETMGARGGEVPLWARHLARWQQSLRRLGVDPGATAGLQAAARQLLVGNGHADGVLRLLRAPRPNGACTWMTSRARDPAAVVTLLPTVARRPPGAPPADMKALPRGCYEAVQREARAGGAMDGIVVGDDGALLETAVGNLWLLLDGVWVTPPLDGRVLPGIARALLLERAPGQGVAVAERPCGFADLHRARALAVSNAVHGPRPAGLVGGTVTESDTSLGVVWRSFVH